MPTSFKASLANAALDARPDRLDLRDRAYTPRLASLPSEYPRPIEVERLLPQYLKDGLVLDQENEGACTGFGLACVINYLFWRRRLDDQTAQPVKKASPRMLYHLAQYYDEWPGEDYEGSSCRGALKGWHRHGVCAEDLWPYRDRNGKVRFVPPSRGWEQDALTRPLGVYFRVNKAAVVDMQAAIFEIGAVYASATVHGGWDQLVRRANAIPEIGKRPPRGDTGGHAFALVGYDTRGFIVQNSWGDNWGLHGFAALPYEDWVENGTDAWVFALGVPRTDRRPRTAIAPSRGVLVPARVGLLARDEETISDEVDDRWGPSQAYLRTVVMDNDGRLLNRLVAAQSAEEAVQRVVVDEARAFFAAQPDKTKRLAIYAHGGLNSEEDSIARISVMGPCFERYGAFPIFMTWKTGPVETIRQALEDEARKIPPEQFEVPPGARGAVLERLLNLASEAKDRVLEIAARLVIARALWMQMKQNAQAAALPGGGSVAVARELARLAQALHGDGGSLELHLVGHSAGSILLGHMLPALDKANLAIASCSLYAPACTLAFANQTYARHFAARAKSKLFIYNLSDENELGDTVGPYGKSLLYLVSRALEDYHKTPLLGFEKSFEPDENDGWEWNIEEERKREALRDLETWQAYWGNREFAVVSRKQVTNGVRNLDATHGSFDNNVEVAAETIERITGKPVKPRELKLDY